MKQIFTLLIAILSTASIVVAQDLSYFLPEGHSYDTSIPNPEEVIGFVPGEWHVTHDQLVRYMYEVAEHSDRVTIEEYGQSYEGRPLVLLTITSQDHRGKLEGIRQNQLALTDPDQSESVNIEEQPVVVYLGNTVHGDEPSGANASMLVLYHLAASRSEQVSQLLQESVILLDPCFNPDGYNRFVSWVNTHKSNVQVSDPAHREHHQEWPGGRTNHYWFDLNRDWMPAQHPESRARLQQFHKWRPNVLTDHHEMGANSTYFFQPGVPSRTHPLTPETNQNLTQKIAEYHARSLDEIQTLYFTKERYDDFYYGKGSTYPDLFGCIGILFEQAGIEGHAVETDHGLLEFPFAIRNQFRTALSTVDAAHDLREDLHEYRRDYYRRQQQKAASDPVKAFVVGDARDLGKNFHFADLLLHHNIEFYELDENLEVGGERFEKGRGFIIPAHQPEYNFLRSIFERRTSFPDSLFYDVSSWTLPLAFDLPFAELGKNKYAEAMRGSKVKEVELPQGHLIGGESDYGYIFAWDEYYAPRVLYSLQEKGIRTKVLEKSAQLSFQSESRNFEPGSILIGLERQHLEPEKIHRMIQKVARENALDIWSLKTGLSLEGLDMGSPSIHVLNKPRAALLVGSGVRAYDAGEIWHLLDQRFEIPLTLIDLSQISSVDLEPYNVFIFADGNYSDLSKSEVARFKRWVQKGGTLILQEKAVRWGVRNQLVQLKKKAPDEKFQYSKELKYADLERARGAQHIGGGIFEAQIDRTHPLCFGIRNEQLPVFRSGKLFYELPENHFSTPVYLAENPLLSGYASDFNLKQMENTPSVVVDRHGKGRVISFIDNPNFRAFWFGTNKLFLNALFFGKTIQRAATN